MKIKVFEDYLLRQYSLNEALVEEVLLRTKETIVSKNTCLLLPGEISKYTYFISEGFFRSFIQLEEKEQTTDFFGPGEMCLIRKSFFRQIKSEEGIVCEKDAVVFKISYYDWKALEDASPEFLSLTNKIVIEDLLKLTENIGVARRFSTRDQYLFLKSQYPGIHSLVAQRYIASYLGISEPTMSGIIKSLLFNPK